MPFLSKSMLLGRAVNGQCHSLTLIGSTSPRKYQQSNQVVIKGSKDGCDEFVALPATPQARPASVGGSAVPGGHHQQQQQQQQQQQVSGSPSLHSPQQPQQSQTRKRPAVSDLNTTDPSSRAGSHAKLEQQSPGPRDQPPSSPEKHPKSYKSRRNHQRFKSVQRAFENLRIDSGKEPQPGLDHVSRQPLSPATGANSFVAKPSLLFDQPFGLPSLAEDPPYGPERTSLDNIQYRDALLARRYQLQDDKPTPSNNEEGEEEDDDDDEYANADQLQFNPTLTKQPNSQRISTQQLGAEVKGIYSGLVMVEAKCIDVIRSQTMPSEETSSQPQRVDQLQTLIALHRTLLHEHHDFFLASQHPSANLPIRQLAARYSMPARMWKHGIHGFLELLRHRLPNSMEYMLSFIYIAYQMMALLYETVPSFEDTWIECLGDLARYRMAIEDEDPVDRDIWTGVARFWYSKTVDKNPGTGRLYHHLAILARRYALQQLALYCNSLLAVAPFLSTRDSIMTLLEPTLARSQSDEVGTMALDEWFVVIHAILFTQASLDCFAKALDAFKHFLNAQLNAQAKGKRFTPDFGEYLAVANISSVLKYGSDTSEILKFYAHHHHHHQQHQHQQQSSDDSPDTKETSQ